MVLHKNFHSTSVRKKVLFLIFFGLVNFVDASDHFTLTNYKLNIKIDYVQSKLFADSELSLQIDIESRIQEIPIILYKDLNVKSVKINDYKVGFEQEVKSLTDLNSFKVNSVKVIVPENFKFNDTPIILSIAYEGTLAGYEETGLTYVKDKIDPDFTIIRPDCLAYPIVGNPELSTLKNITLENFDYQLSITVPYSFFVVNAGRLVKTIEEGDYKTFKYKSTKPSYQMVTTIAKYASLQNNNIFTYYFEDHHVSAQRTHNMMLLAFSKYSKWWGALETDGKFSLIQIPEGYGSQANENFIIQTASAFNDPDQIRQLFHEVSHLWNVKSNDKHPPRWNEGLATFLEYLTTDKLQNKNTLEAFAKTTFETLKANKEYGEVPLINFGKQHITDRSYHVGFMMFYLIYKNLGDRKFHKLIKSYRQEYGEVGSTTLEFTEFVEQHFGTRLNAIFRDWMYTTNYYNHIERSLKIEDLVQKSISD